MFHRSNSGTGLTFTFLTRWGRVTHICISKLTIVASDNGLSPGRRQAIIWTYDGILSIGNKLQWNLNQNSYIFIQENAFEKVVCEMAAILSRPQCVKAICVFYVWIYALLEWVDIWQLCEFDSQPKIVCEWKSLDLRKRLCHAWVNC